MKLLRIWALLFILIVSFPVTAGAHVALKSSQPADGETVTAEVDSIELTFSGEILPMSKLVITDETGVETAPLETVVSEGTLKAKLAAPLPNGTYNVKWNIAAQDGHSLEGGIQFIINVEPQEEIPPSESANPDPAVEAPADESTVEVPEREPVQVQEPAQGNQGQVREFVPFIAAAGVLILAVFILLAFRPKRKL